MTPTPTPKADYLPFGAGHTHDLIPLEWTTRDPKGRDPCQPHTASRIEEGLRSRELFDSEKE
jgi:hypothetical protein